MKRAILSALLVLGMLGLTLPGQSGIHKLKYPEMKPFNLPALEKAQLDNGLRLRLIKEDKLPMFQLTVWLKGGDVYDPADRIGLMGLMAETMRIGGTEKHSPDEMDLLLESKGISIGMYNSPDSIRVSCSALSEDFDQAVALMAEMIRRPRFDAEKMNETKTRMSSGISRRNDEPSPIAQREFSRLVYGPDFTAGAVMDYVHLDNIERQDLVASHRRFFAPDNMLVGYSGPMALAEVKGVFEKYFGDWQDKASLPPFPNTIKSAEGIRLAFIEKSDLTQSYVCMGYLGDLWKAEEAAAVSVFNTIFSQGFDSRLFTRVRTKEGLTYGVGGGINRNFSYPGLTSFTTFTKSGSTFKAVRSMLDEMQRIRREPVTPQELQDAKDYLLNSNVFKFSSPESVLNRRMSQEFYGLPADMDDKFVEQVKGVTAADIQRIAEQYIHPDKMMVVVLGKEADLDEKLDAWAPLKKLDITIPPPPLKEKFPEFSPESLAKGQEIWKKAVAAGYRNYQKLLKSSRSTMDVTITMPQGKMQMKMTDTTRYPDYSHQQMEIMGMKIITVTTPEGGYVDQMGQKKALSAEEVNQNRFARFHDLLTQADTFRIQFLKEDVVDGQPVNVLLVRDEEGSKWKKLFVNQKSGLLMAEESLMDMMGQGKKPGRTVYGDYRQVKGLPFAHTVRVEFDGKPFMESKVTQVEVNPALDDSLFKLD